MNNLPSQICYTLEDLSCKVVELEDLPIEDSYACYEFENNLEYIKEFIFDIIEKQRTLRRGRRKRPKKELRKHMIKHIRREFIAIERCLHESFMTHGIERQDLLKWTRND